MTLWDCEKTCGTGVGATRRCKPFCLAVPAVRAAAGMGDWLTRRMRASGGALAGACMP